MSSTTRNRPTGRNEVRRAVLTAASRNFAVRGPAASLRDIAVDANVSLRLIPRHFGNKDGLLQAVLEEYEGRDVALVDGSANLADAVRTLFEQSQLDGDHIRLLAWLALIDHEPAPTHHHGALHQLAARASNEQQRLGLLGALALVYGWTIFGDQLLRVFDRTPAELPTIEDHVAGLLDWLLTDETTRAIAKTVTAISTADGTSNGTSNGTSIAASTGAETVVAAGSRPSGRDEVRQAIVTAASRQFAIAGLDASLRQIAADAQVNLGLIHRHFGNKDNLLRAVIAAPIAVGLDAVASAPSVAVALRQLYERRPTSGDYSRILAFLLLTSTPTEQFIDRYPAIDAMRKRTSNDEQELRLLAGFALAHGWTVFGDSLLQAIGNPSTSPDQVRTRIGAVIETLVAG